MTFGQKWKTEIMKIVYGRIDSVEENKYENVIANYTYEQLVFESAILNEQETTLYNKKKALKEEFKKRLRERQE